MSEVPTRPAKVIKLNMINEPKDSYTGGPSSLCPGCGHDQISLSALANSVQSNWKYFIFR